MSNFTLPTRFRSLRAIRNALHDLTLATLAESVTPPQAKEIREQLKLQAEMMLAERMLNGQDMELVDHPDDRSQIGYTTIDITAEEGD